MSEFLISALGLGALYLFSNTKNDEKETFKNNVKKFDKGITSNFNNNLPYQERINGGSSILNPQKNTNNINNYSNNNTATKIYETNNINLKDTNINTDLNCNSKKNIFSNEDNNYFKSLSGKNILESDLKHNNMEPFYGSKLNKINLNKGHDLENKTGVSSINIKKEAIAPLFKPEKNMNYVQGAPNNNEFYRNRMYVSDKKNNYKPWEEISVGPGLNTNDTTNGSLGFNAGIEGREIWGPKNVDQLRVLTNPKNSYCLNGNEGPAYDPTINPGAFEGKSKIILGKMEKNRPERFHANCGIENMGNARGINKETNRSKQMLTEENRAFLTKEYYGPGKGENSERVNGNYKESNKINLAGPINHVRVSNINNKNLPENQRQTHTHFQNSRTTTKTEPMGILNGIFKATIAPIVDILKPSKKEELINNYRQEGIISGGYIKQRTWDPNNKLKTTIKEQTSINKYKSHPSKNNGMGYITNKHHAVKNQRDTTNKPYVSQANQNYGKGYLTNEYQPVQNQRDTTNFSYVSQPNKNNGNGYLTNEYQPVKNQRDTTNVFIIGGAGATKGTLKTMQTNSEYTRPMPNKEMNIKCRPNAGNMSLFNNNINYTQLGEKTTYQYVGNSNMPKQSITNDNYGIQTKKPLNNTNINNERIQGNILDAFKKNPYSHSLTSFA